MLDHRTLLLLPALLLAPIASADADPAHLALSIDGVPTLDLALDAELAADGAARWTGLHEEAGWSLEWDWRLAGDPDRPVLEGTVVFTNDGGSTRAVDLRFDAPLCPRLEGAMSMNGSATVRVVAGGDGAVLFTPGGASAWSARLDDADAATLFDGPFLLTASGAGQMSTGDALPESDAPAALERLGQRLQFRLSPGDLAEFAGDLAVHGADVALVDCAEAELDPADFDADGSVGLTDLVFLLGDWGACRGCATDLNADARVNFSDLLLLLDAWS